jgi:hypothetical protein
MVDPVDPKSCYLADRRYMGQQGSRQTYDQQGVEQHC